MSNRETEFPQDTDDPLYGSLTFPIYQTSSFMLPKGEKYRYSRENNPTVEALSRRIASLEGFSSGNSFSSGMGAITTTLLAFLRPGDSIIIQRGLFARSYKFITSFLSDFGINVTVTESDTGNLVSALNSSVKMVFIESITNPILRVNDIPLIAEKCSETETLLVVDSTFTTPYNLRGSDSGASVVLHSASKFISGHNDIIAGVLSGKEEFVDKIDLMRRNLGASMDPHTAFLVMRGLKTLALRMSRINSSAMKIAEELSVNKQVSRTIYPGLPDHPDYDIARRILQGNGGVVSFDLGKDVKSAIEFLGRLRLVKPANTLGGITTTITHPSTMSHRGLTDGEKQKAGISPGLLRLSVGIEDTTEIIADLLNALDQ